MLQRYFSAPTNAQLLSFTEWLDAYALQAAQRMITGLRIENAKDWRAAARESMLSRTLYPALQRELRGPIGKRLRDLTAQNAALIRSLPLSISEQVTRHVARHSLAGERATTIRKSLARYTAHVARYKVQLIARTEVSKTQTALTQARAENLGIDWYIWRSSEDGRVRQSHRFMAARGGILVNWKDAPSPEQLIGQKSTLGHYHAGNCPNCRCYGEPFMRFDQVRWPHPVYASGRVTIMTLSQFRRFTGIDRGVARLGLVA
jgi:SPP1 gp7 family putative phage head morphogenesis protein